MEKIITINLAGQILPIEEPAYNRLNAYFDSLRTYFRTQTEGDEILADIESRVAELLVAKVRLGVPAINALHIAEVESQLGSVADFREADGAEPNPEKEGLGSAPPHKRRRFFRDPTDKVLGGVCAGLAGYFNVDPALVRIIFGVLALAGWGTGILLYLALWFLVPESAENAYRGRRLYRSAEDKWLGGVCGGLAAYFDKDPWVFRLLFGIPLLFGTGFLHGFSFLFGSLSGAAVLIYILLWMVLPIAKTDFQKMELRGEKIDLHTIRDNVYGDLKARSQSFTREARQAADRLSSEAKTVFGPTARTGASALGRLVRTVFLGISIVVAALLFALLIGYFFGDFSKMANLYLFQSPRQKTLAFLTVILLLGVPLLSVLTSMLRNTLHLPYNLRYLRLTFSLLWIGGFVAFAFLLSSLSHHFNREETVRQTLPVSVADSGILRVRAVGEPVQYQNTLAGIRGHFKGLDVDADSLRSSWLDFRTVPSPDNQYRITILRTSYGRTSAEARQRAGNIVYPMANAVPMSGILSLPAGFAIAQPDYYRGQQLAVELQIPVGRQVQFDASMENALLHDFYAETSYGYNRGRKRWHYRRRWQPAPTTEVTYTMGTDGTLHQADGLEEDRTPAEDWDNDAEAPEKPSGHVI